MKKYSAFTSAFYGSRPLAAFPQIALSFALVLASVLSLGCQAVTPYQYSTKRVLESNRPNTIAAKPAVRQHSTIAQTGSIQSTGNSGYRVGQGEVQTDSRYSVQQATYQYPATNVPGEPPRFIGNPQDGFVPQTIPQQAYPQNLPGGFQRTALPTALPQQPNIGSGQPVPQPAFQGQPIIQGQPVFQGQPNLQGQPVFQGQPIIQGPIYQPGQYFQPPNLPPAAQPEMIDLDVYVPQNPSGRRSVGGTYSSDNGFLGQFVIEEHDFDFRNPPQSLREALTSPYAWRGGGQRFRLEAVPGSDLQRYLVSWSDPYFRNTDTSLSLSAYLFDRKYFDWDEQRLGGKINLGRRLNQYLSVNGGLRMERVKIDNPRVGTSPQLNADLGKNNLFLANVGLVYDTRVLPYLTGVGTYLGLNFTQAFGDYSFSKGEIDFRNHRTIFQRVDGSGRHTLGFRSKLGFTGSDTPVFENYFAGGISSLRGFEFRGISPIDGGARVGGEFQWLNSLEYNFPLTADDMIAGALFVDFGTVEEDIELNSDNFRVAPGFGLRVHVPYLGLGAPLSFDFAFPVETGAGDEEQQFSIFIGALR